MNTINLTSFGLRNEGNDRELLLDKLQSLGCDVDDFQRTSSVKLVTVAAILEKAKDNVIVALPPIPFRRVTPTREFYAYCKHDAVMMGLQVFGEYGLTAGIASELSALALTGMLKTVKADS